MKQIGKHLLKCISYIMSGVMLCTLFITYEAAAAKKPTLNKKKCGITIHETTKLTIKNGSKKAKVTWKSKKPKIAKITKKKTLGKSAYAVVKGIKPGNSTITASYKLNKNTLKLKCKITVTDTKEVKPMLTQAPQDQNNPAPANPTVKPTNIPTDTPAPTAVPTPTPVPFANLVEVNELEECKTAPDIFTYIDKTQVTAENWNGRAEEIRQMYQYYMYGMWRDGEGESLSYIADGNNLKIDISTDGSIQGQKADANASFTVDVNIPDGSAPEGGWPVIISMGNLTEQQTALDNGYAVINYDTAQVSSDSAARSGAFYTLYPYNAKEWREQSGVLMAWAWGASKILDALYAGAGGEYSINPDFAIIGGVSRWGKATAVTGAFDRRFKIALPTCSGCGGMGVFRYNPNAAVTQTYDVSSLGYMSTATYKQGDIETLGSIQSSGESYWFNERFKQFKNIYQLPFDQYYLSSLYAEEGRTLMLIGGFNFDIWQNTPSLWYNFQKAKQVFDMLGLSSNIIINLHDAAMGHNILNDDVVKLFKYCSEMYFEKDVEGFEISDLQTTLFELTDTPAGINNKEIYEAQIPEDL